MTRAIVKNTGVALLVSLLLGGCGGGEGVPQPDAGTTFQPYEPYDYCESSAECGAAASSCVDVAATWNGEAITHTQPVCTITCSADIDCPDVTVGAVTYEGTCVAAGTIGTSALCAQGCQSDSDCILGFECADDQELAGVAAGHPVCVAH